MPETAWHDLPLCQLLALTSYAAYCHGMEPENGGYEEWEFDRTLAAIKVRDADARRARRASRRPSSINFQPS